MAAILRFGRTCKPEVAPEVELHTKIGHAIPYLLSFWSMLKLQNWLSYGDFKIWHTFWPRDLVIWPLTYKNYRLLRASRLHMGMKFGDDRSKTATCIAVKTDRQTDKQTDKPSNEHTCQNCKILASNKMSKTNWEKNMWYNKMFQLAVRHADIDSCPSLCNDSNTNTRFSVPIVTIATFSPSRWSK